MLEFPPVLRAGALPVLRAGALPVLRAEALPPRGASEVVSDLSGP